MPGWKVCWQRGLDKKLEIHRVPGGIYTPE